MEVSSWFYEGDNLPPLFFQDCKCIFILSLPSPSVTTKPERERYSISSRGCMAVPDDRPALCYLEASPGNALTAATCQWFPSFSFPGKRRLSPSLPEAKLSWGNVCHCVTKVSHQLLTKRTDRALALSVVRKDYVFKCHLESYRAWSQRAILKS